MTDVLRPSSERPMRIELAGEIDLANAKSLGDCLCHALDLTNGTLVVDMTSVSFIDSSAMAMMLRVHQAAVAQHGTVSWRGIQHFPMKALALAGLETLLVLDE
jgi:anti-anti-sigma factor